MQLRVFKWNFVTLNACIRKINFNSVTLATTLRNQKQKANEKKSDKIRNIK